MVISLAAIFPLYRLSIIVSLFSAGEAVVVEGFVSLVHVRVSLKKCLASSSRDVGSRKSQAESLRDRKGKPVRNSRH
jgi:hypothetical protein